MTRQEALEQFGEEEKQRLEEAKQQFWTRLEEQTDELARVLKKVLFSIREEMEKLEKEKLMHLYFSLLRTDLLKQEYRIMVQAMDARWYMDTEQACVTFSIDFLFNILDPLWDKLLDSSRKYLGKVNLYDIGHMIQDLAMECNQLLSHQLRFMLRDIEENQDFSAIPKEDAWYIRWGEYRDNSEIIACVDRVAKDQLTWERAVRKTKDKEDALVAGYWYGTEIRENKCQDKAMYFINFESCTLTNISFDRSNMAGARFRNCILKGCSFMETILRQAEFRDCTWEDSVFTGADLTNAVFMEQELPFVHLEAEQLQIVLIDRGKE